MHPLTRNELNRYICLGLTLQRNVNATYTIEYVISIRNVQNATNNFVCFLQASRGVYVI